MATVPNPPPPPVVVSSQAPVYVTSSGDNTEPSSGTPSHSSEIKLISHSSLFYWWPVWAVSFIMAFFTYVENTRLAFVTAGTTVEQVDESNKYILTVPAKEQSNSLLKAANLTKYNASNNLQNNPVFDARISGKSWPGGIFITTLILTIIVTNVPLRGLWSFLVIISVIVVALLFALLDWWDEIFRLLGNVHVHLNMAAYMTIGILMFIIWALATFLFDRRSFVIFTPGQIKVCEHIGASVETYPTNTVALQKQRDDLFRHYIFGLGSGDLIIKVAGPDRREIRLPNVLFLGFRLSRVEDMLRTVTTT